MQLLFDLSAQAALVDDLVMLYSISCQDESAHCIFQA